MDRKSDLFTAAEERDFDEATPWTARDAARVAVLLFVAAA